MELSIYFHTFSHIFLRKMKCTIEKSSHYFAFSASGSPLPLIGGYDRFMRHHQERPMKVIACVGLGLCLARHHHFPVGEGGGARKRSKLTPRFEGVLPLWGISDLKSNAVGKCATPGGM